MSGEHCCSRSELKNHGIALALLLLVCGIISASLMAFSPPVIIFTMNNF
jgi:hypothetical protein